MNELAWTKVERHSKFPLGDYYHKSHSTPTMVFKVITVQRIFRVATAITIQKTICGIEWDLW